MSVNNRERFPDVPDPNHMCYSCARLTETEIRGLHRCKPLKGEKPFWRDYAGCADKKWHVINSGWARYGEICPAFTPAKRRGEK